MGDLSDQAGPVQALSAFPWMPWCKHIIRTESHYVHGKQWLMVNPPLLAYNRGDDWLWCKGLRVHCSPGLSFCWSQSVLCIPSAVLAVPRKGGLCPLRQRLESPLALGEIQRESVPQQKSDKGWFHCFALCVYHYYYFFNFPLSEMKAFDHRFVWLAQQRN